MMSDIKVSTKSDELSVGTNTISGEITCSVIDIDKRQLFPSTNNIIRLGNKYINTSLGEGSWFDIVEKRILELEEKLAKLTAITKKE